MMSGSGLGGCFSGIGSALAAQQQAGGSEAEQGETGGFRDGFGNRQRDRIGGTGEPQVASGRAVSSASGKIGISGIHTGTRQARGRNGGEGDHEQFRTRTVGNRVASSHRTDTKCHGIHHEEIGWRSRDGHLANTLNVGDRGLREGVVEPETTVLVVIVVGSAVVLMVSGALKAVPFSVPAKVPLKV